MLINELPSESKSLTVPKRDVQVVLSEEGLHAFALVLPPVEDIRDIHTFRGSQVSIEDQVGLLEEKMATAYRKELDFLKADSDEHARSPIYFNRLANLAAAAGELEEEAGFLKLARELSNDVFFVHREGDNLLSRERTTEAESLFSALDLRSDLYANLRVAMFRVQRKDTAGAFKCIETAIEIDPTNYGVRLFEGGLALATQQFERAIHAFRIAATERPTSTVLFANWAIAYIAIGETEKAFAAIRRAVALGPLNANAICIYADLAFREHRDEDAVPALRYLAQFEQKHGEVWSRLARACLQLHQYDEAIVCLKREAAVNESRRVWNNIGVAQRLAGNFSKAQQAFKHAIEMKTEEVNADFYVASRNMAQTLNELGKPAEVVSFARAVLASDEEGACLKEKAAADVHVLRLSALRKLGRFKEAEEAAKKILGDERASRELFAWTLGFLVTNYALSSEKLPLALEMIDKYRDRIEEFAAEDGPRNAFLINNIAFALAEAGETTDAERLLRSIADSIHKDAYPTATLGLIHLRRGHLDKATYLYEEAVRLAQKRDDKLRIRQKLNLELGRYWITRNPSRGRQFLEKAASERRGEIGLSESASREMATLRGS